MAVPRDCLAQTWRCKCRFKGQFRAPKRTDGDLGACFDIPNAKVGSSSILSPEAPSKNRHILPTQPQLQKIFLKVLVLGHLPVLKWNLIYKAGAVGSDKLLSRSELSGGPFAALQARRDADTRDSTSDHVRVSSPRAPCVQKRGSSHDNVWKLQHIGTCSAAKGCILGPSKVWVLREQTYLGKESLCGQLAVVHQRRGRHARRL